MSELREEILGGGINKKRIIGVVLVALLLISVFAFSTFFFSFLFGSQRTEPSKQKKGTTEEFPELRLPPYPFDAEFWQDLFDQIDPADIPALLDMLSEMFDGDIDDLDLGNFSQGLLDLLFLGAGEMEVFRVFNYLSFGNMSDVLWKMESFDEFTGTGWHSTASSDLYSFYAYGDYYSNYAPNPELFKIKMPMSPQIGVNSLVIPSLFPIPFIMEYPPSISAPNLNPAATKLYKTEFNSTTLDLSFSSDVDVNMTYEMFGLPLPSAQSINNSAVEASFTPAPIQSKYLQLPPTIEIYKGNNPSFANHTNILNTTINDNDNAYEVSNKIRNYLQTQFTFPLDPDDYNPAPDGYDVVEWFSETQQGLWPDFASAFCAFSRVFGVSSRFIDGFSSLAIEEIYDYDEGQTGFAIKYKNLYNWAEVYIPTDISGNGQWIQFDIFDNFGGGGNPILGGNYNLTVLPDQIFYNRPDIATLTAKLSSASDPIDGKTITFTDLTTGQNLGQNITNSNGTTSINFNLNNSHVVGPHIIEAQYDFFTVGYNLTTILGNISVSLSSINPTEINRSDLQPDSTNIQGYVFDPLNGERVKDAEINAILFQKGTSIEEINAFSPSSIITDSNGDFDDILDLNPSVQSGQFEIRADFNGTWQIDTPLGIIPYIVPTITNSSNKLELNVTKALTTWFYINNTPVADQSNPRVSRYQTLNLTAKVVLEGFGSVPNKQVTFHDYSRGGVEIGSGFSDTQGLVSVSYFVDDYCRAGPNLLYSKIASMTNYSYFIVDENPTINAISGPTPRVINRTGFGATQFNIVGDITDSTNSSIPLGFTEITLTLMKGSINYSQYLIPIESYPYQTDSSGTFDLTFGVAPNTPPGNYSLRLDFNGTINLMTYPYPYNFNLPFINTSTFYSNDLKIDAEASLLFWINGTTSDDAYNPIINRYDSLNLTTYIHQAGTPIVDGEWVFFFDATQDNLYIGADQTNGGYAEVDYVTNDNTTAGPHLLYATWNNKFNFSYFILNAPIGISLDIGPQPPDINRTGAIGRNFQIHGYLNDSKNGNPIKFNQIQILLYDGPTDVSFYLNLESGSLWLGGTGEIDLTYSVTASTPAKNYTVLIICSGIFIYTTPVYPQFFNLGFLTNLTDLTTGFNDLRVIDPYNINIFFEINGSSTLSFYSDPQPPERFMRGDDINFSVSIIQSGIPVTSGTVRIYDVFNNNMLGFYPYIGGDGGYHEFIISTAGWHGGLHRIKVNWSGFATFNTTYVIINESVSIFSSIDKSSILRSTDGFIVSGTVQENSVLLRGLGVTLILLDDSYSDVSGYLTGPQTVTTNAVGYFQFGNSINIACPQGQYYLRVDFNGTINAIGISMSNYMIHNSSLRIPINITADTSLNGNYETEVVKDDWYFGDNCFVYGNLNWDNSTSMALMEINITIRDGFGVILDTQTGFTDAFGFFNLTFVVGNWDNPEVWVYFYPDDLSNFGVPDGFYITTIQQQLFRFP
ncbi:hypothetical protein LCGC14_0710310 [marine sediment metagenome]|uniref:Transglutaminase-like domain-containing protein n=1 Tax=marine sediment metagenome TaxID=412755 RepID=A0A0F9TMT6_9ZZZZ